MLNKLKTPWVGPLENPGDRIVWERPTALALLIPALILLLTPYLLDKLKIRDRWLSNWFSIDLSRARGSFLIRSL